jgi:hypothetical protein
MHRRAADLPLFAVIPPQLKFAEAKDEHLAAAAAHAES